MSENDNEIISKAAHLKTAPRHLYLYTNISSWQWYTLEMVLRWITVSLTNYPASSHHQWNSRMLKQSSCC